MSLVDTEEEDRPGGPVDPVAKAMWDERLARQQSKRVSTVEMMAALEGEIVRIVSTQSAMIAGGLRIEPHPGEIKRAVVFEEAHKLLGLILQNADKLRPILYPPKRRT